MFALGSLYLLVALLVAVPPVYLLLTVSACDPEPCSWSSRSLFTAQRALFWLVPFGAAAVLLAVAFKLKRRA